MTDQTFDIAVVGAGAAGLAASLCFAREGLSVCLIGSPEARRDGRTVALLDGSVKLLRALGVWDAVQQVAAPLEVMRLIDDTANLFRAPIVSFNAGEIGLDAFGWNVENTELVEILHAAARNTSGLTIIGAQALAAATQDIWTPGSHDPGSEDHRISVTLSSGGPILASLLVAADGRNSRLREGAGIGTRRWTYPQSALTTILAHDRDHRETSTEFHTRHGPFTLVPLPGRRSSLVWVTQPRAADELMQLGDEELAAAIERQAQSILGRMRLDGPRGLVPMSGLSVERFAADRLALVGETAHVFPPIGAQGLNLGLRDVAALRDCVVAARARGTDLGGREMLAAYESGRRLDVGLRTAAVDALNRTLLADMLPADFLRGAGLRLLSTIGPLRRIVMREGLAPRIGTPQLMREPSAA